MWLLELALAPLAQAEPLRTVVTFDNGGFNAPLYASRHQGHARPSVARETAAALSRVIGANPEVWSYLPPGRREGRPGDPWRVWPRLEGCEGAAEQSGDPCWCGPGDRCWQDLDVNRHPGGSTSLYLTAARIRETSGSRIEVHFTDLFEEDPSAAEDPADSDRCVTRDGVRRAVAGLLVPGTGGVDHVAVGMLRARIDPPPPGRDVGSSFRFVEGEGGCWSGERTGTWDATRSPLDFAVAVVVIGVGTADRHADVAAFVRALETQLDTDEVTLDLVALKEPLQQGRLEAALGVGELTTWSLPAAAAAPGVPCGAVVGEANLTLDGHAVAASLVGACDGTASLTVPPDEAIRAWTRAHGLDPMAGPGRLQGTLGLRSDTASLEAALAALEARGGEVVDRPLPMLGVLGEVARAGVSSPWQRRVDLDVAVDGLDRRPWWFALALGAAIAALSAVVVYAVALRLQANRVYQAAWERSAAEDADPLRQRPVAVVLAEARQDLRARWAQRAVASLAVASVAGLVAAWLVLRAHLVLHG